MTINQISMTNNTLTRLDFIRHGSPVGGRKYRGSNIDDPLSEKGWEQMHASTQEFMDWDVIISSPLKRCHEFAHKLADTLSIECEIMPTIKEVGFGAWEGLESDWIKENKSSEYKKFFDDPVNCRPKGAEALDKFSQRINQSIEQIILKHQHKKCLIVCHAGVIRAALGWCLDAPAKNWYKAKVDPGSISRITISENQIGLNFFNHSPQ